MHTLTLNSERSSTFSSIIRLVLGAFGLAYLMFCLLEYVATYELTSEVVINGSLGIGFLLAAIFNKKAWDPSTVILNDKFIRTKENTSYTRTAYWSKIETLTLTRFGIRIKYQSGTPERFRLPYLSSAEHNDLCNWLQNISAKNNIRFSQKAWWKPF